MINLYDGQITDILPENIKDDVQVQALSHAIGQANQKLMDYAKLSIIDTAINELPDEVLDLLALELRSQYYTQSLDIKVKREIIKNTLVWYTKAGTASAVEEMVNTVFGYGKVTEWFDYNGEPFHFKILTDTVLTEDITDLFSSAINQVKNVRSVLDAIDIVRSSEQTLYAGGEMIQSIKPEAILNNVIDDLIITGIQYFGIGLNSFAKPEAISE